MTDTAAAAGQPVPVYLNPPVVTDPAALTANALAWLVANVPRFRAAEGHLETFLLAAVAREVSVLRDLASAVPISIWRFYGTSILGLAPLTAAFATISTTWTMKDAGGYTVSAGTLVGWGTIGTQVYGFRTVADFTVAPGSTTQAGVTVQAVAAGASFNGFGPGNMVLIDALSYVTSVHADTASSGGADAETDVAYLNRLVADAQTLGPKPVTASDYATMARNVAGVYRALVIDGYNADTATSGNERTVGIFALDSSGNAVGAPVNTAIRSYFDALREVGFVVTTGAPTITAINVAYSASVVPGSDPVATTALVNSTLTSYLSAASWGGGGQTPPVWNPETIVRYLDIAGLIDRVWGVNHVLTLTLNGAAADVALAGIAPLPSIGAITGGVT